MRAAQAGDERAFAALYDEHAPRVLAVCLGIVGEPAAAAELVQDTFVRVWESLPSFRGDCAFTTWLHRVAVNTTLASERAGKRRALRVAIDADLRGTSSPADGAASLDAEVRDADPALAMDLERAIAQLPPGARAVFVLHDITGFQHHEIADQLGVAVGTSKAHLFRARRLMREMLDR